MGNRELKIISVVVILLVMSIVCWYELMSKTQNDDSIIWLRKGLNWDYQIKLIHKPNDQVVFLSHGQEEVKPCDAPSSLISMLIGFVFWYRGLDQGGIAAVGQLQLLQPFFGLLLSALVLNESIGWPIRILNIGVVLCMAIARRFTAKKYSQSTPISK